MDYLNPSFATPAENLACDEALLDGAEAGEWGEVLRFWESPGVFVVIGRGNQARTEVNLASCAEAQVPVLRRCSGGGAVVQGPGCLNYALVLDTAWCSALATVAGTNRHVLAIHAGCVSELLPGRVEVAGVTDLTWNGRKFSGNAQRRRRRFTLFHGTFLLAFDLAWIERLLPLPSRSPAYRAGRGHNDFLVNIPVDSARLRAALRRAWGASAEVRGLPADRLTGLVESRYRQAAWNRAE
jgi:lipoate-protein ligase A